MISSFCIAKTGCRKKKAFKDNIRVSSLSAKSNKVNIHSAPCEFPPQDSTYVSGIVSQKFNRPSSQRNYNI
jgi:hypothetical protein